MRISVVPPAELSLGEIEAWRTMQARTEVLASPFLCPEFAIEVGRARAGARVGVLSDGNGEPAGFFPFERRRLGVGVPIGAGLSDCQGVVQAPGVRCDPAELLGGCGLSVWHFDHLVAGQQPFEPWQAAVAASPVMDLAGGFAAYAAQSQARSPRFWKDLARKTRKIEREVGPLKHVVDSPDAGDLRTLMGWKSDQYRRTGRGDRFDRPWIVELVERLLGYRGAGGNGGAFRGVLSMLYAGDTPVAGHLGLAHGGMLAEWFPAYDTSFARYSPGLIQLVGMAREAEALGVAAIDLGKGDMRYKEELKSFELTVGEGTATSRSALAAAHRARLAPPRWAVRQIRRRRALYVTADKMLKGYGKVRVALKRGE
jgi:CelD/BcsL family acetyltransferase involved in cellulose biosynthesis